VYSKFFHVTFFISCLAVLTSQHEQHSATMSDHVEDIISLVKVTDVQEKKYVAGTYKEVGLQCETGFWSHGFLVNIFPNHDHFDDIAMGDKLTMQVVLLISIYQATIMQQCIAVFSLFNLTSF
jgi:hypothetical protein